jgi:hypothetical protein
MDWTIGFLGFYSQKGAGNFSLHHGVQTALEQTQPPIQSIPGALSLGVKRPGREAYHSLLSSAEVKNVWSYTSTLQYVFMAWCLVKHRDNFTCLPFIHYIWYDVAVTFTASEIHWKFKSVTDGYKNKALFHVEDNDN